MTWSSYTSPFTAAPYTSSGRTLSWLGNANTALDVFERIRGIVSPPRTPTTPAAPAPVAVAARPSSLLANPLVIGGIIVVLVAALLLLRRK